MRRRLLAVSIVLAIAAVFFVGRGLKPNQVDNQISKIDPTKIIDGGPGKDGIPSIDKPKFTSVDQASWLKDSDLVLIVSHDDQTKAYPILIMNWHEIVNDKIGAIPIAVTYCPLCGSGIAYKRIFNGEEVQFGVSGKLYNSDLLMYDRKTDSLWSQITGIAVQGPLAGQKLEIVETNLVNFKTLNQKYPDAQVLSKDTGFTRDYSRSPYGDYDTSSQIYFPVDYRSDKLFAKERIIGVELSGAFKAYKLTTLKEKREIIDKSIILKMNDKGEIVVTTQDGQRLGFINTFWFAWVAFHPGTEIYR